MEIEEVEELEVELSEPQSDVMTARTALILDMAGQASGKTEIIGLSSGYLITEFPEMKGFIAANTYMQLTQSTLNKAFKAWEKYYNLTEYDAKNNPEGHFVIDKQPPAHFIKHEKFKNYNGIISFRSGAMVFVGSLDNYKAHDGKEFGWAHLDETKDTKKEALTTVILGRLRQYGLWVDPDGDVFYDNKLSAADAEEQGLRSWNPCYIHTSPAEGGVDWIIEMFKLGDYEEEIRSSLADPYDYFFKQDAETTVVIYQTYWNEHNLPPGYINSRKAQLSENEQLKFIDGYPFSKSGGEFFPHFNRKLHVKDLTFDPDYAHHLTYDFNVMPYMTQLAAQVQYVYKWWHVQENRKCEVEEPGTVPFEVLQIRFYKEYCMKSPQNTTEETAQAFIDDMEAYDSVPDVFIYGDASGRNRITGLGSLTQYRILEGKLARYLPEGWMRVRKANIGVMKRRDLLNRIWEGKIPGVEVLIDNSCKELIRDCEYLKQDAKGKYKEKEKDPQTGITYEKIGHTSDAMEYLVCELCKQYLKDF